MDGGGATPAGYCCSNGIGVFDKASRVGPSDRDNLVFKIIGGIVQPGAVAIADDNECSRTRRCIRVVAQRECNSCLKIRYRTDATEATMFTSFLLPVSANGTRQRPQRPNNFMGAMSRYNTLTIPTRSNQERLDCR